MAVSAGKIQSYWPELCFINTTMHLRLLALFILILGPIFSVAAPRCGDIFDSRQANSARVETLAKHLIGDDLVAEKTVRFVRFTDGDIYLAKKQGLSWNSTYEIEKGAKTPQGDVRNFIAMAGPELALRMGFEITQNSEDAILKIPGSEKLKRLVEKMNVVLKTRGQEPISYLPVAAGFVGNKEALDLSVAAKDDFLFQFPYADKMPHLVPHEISFHLGSMLLPRKFFVRAREISLLNQKFISYLEQHGSALGESRDRLIAQMYVDRNFEVDVGTGNMVSILASVRKQGFNSISQILPYKKFLFNSRLGESLPKYIEILSRPQYTPLETLILRVATISGMNLGRLKMGSKVLSQEDTVGFKKGQRYGAAVDLNAAQLEKLTELLNSFLGSVPNRYENLENKSPVEWSFDLLLELDNRIEELKAVFSPL